MEKLIEALISKIKAVTNEITQSIIYQFLEWFRHIIYLHFEKKTPSLVPCQRDIYEIDLGQNIGSELNKKRPCIVISDAPFNKGNTIIILPLKSIKENTKIGIITISLSIGEAGLNKPTYCSCFNIREVSKKRIEQYIGTIAKEDSKKIMNSLTVIFGLKKTSHLDEENDLFLKGTTE